jgi:hypothetical protein
MSIGMIASKNIFTNNTRLYIPVLARYCCLLLRVGSNNRLTYNRLGILIICRNLIFSGHLLQPEGGHKLPVTGILLLTYDT